MTLSTQDFGSSLLSAFGRAIGLLALLAGVGLVFVFAFAAAVGVGLLILGAAIAQHFWPRRADSALEGMLEARHTPSGWVVETRTGWKH